jgi:DHA2 family multidrug resistance protein
MIAEVESSTQWKPKSNPWLIAATVALAAFMEVLDTSIANVALPHIANALGASTSQGTWGSPATWSPMQSFCQWAHGPPA